MGQEVAYMQYYTLTWDVLAYNAYPKQASLTRYKHYVNKSFTVSNTVPCHHTETVS